MYNKKTSLLKAFFAATKRIFHARNIIIVSSHKVDHVPLTGLMQILLLIGLVGFFSGTSYITGSYLTARSALKDKEQKIASTTMEKVRINDEMSLLKRDLVKLSQNGKELSTYSKFIVDQYANNDQPAAAQSATPFTSNNVFAENNDTLLNRISYLENRMRAIRDDNDRLVSAIRERTDKKISDFQEIIEMTGLDPDRLEHMSAKNISKYGNQVSSASPLTPTPPVTGPIDASGNPDEDDSADEETPVRTNANQGGPYIPYDTTSFNDADRELLANVDRLVLLHDIVEQLPLSQPIADAQLTGPFGKRVDPFNGRWSIHPGLDLAGPVGARIYCTSNGKVISAGRKIAYGNMVDVDHGFGIVTRYAHMSKIIVHEGQVLHKGDQIGVEGSTGRSTGPHLHYEVRINDRPVNPVKFLHAGEYVLEN
jgi:murein DD-endopeptidase MepM/ murein hydrolase activator NlpD